MSKESDPVAAVARVLRSRGVLAEHVPEDWLLEAIADALDAADAAEEVAQRCDEPGCMRPASCGWPDGEHYRRTCFEHWKRS